MSVKTYDAIVKQCDIAIPSHYFYKNERLQLALQLICAEIDNLKETGKKPSRIPPSFARQLILGLPFITCESELWSGIKNGIYLNPNMPNETCYNVFQILTAGETLTADMIEKISYTLIEEKELIKPDTDSRIYKSYIFDLK